MTILDRIVADTRSELEKRRRTTPASSLEAEPGFQRTPLRLDEALRGDTLAIIAETKKASPSKGVIRGDYDPAKIGRDYENAGASAVSVLTEPLHFQGSPQHLKDVRAAVALPLLRKDFIIDVYQLVEARALGADAVLLIAAVLDRPQLHDLQQAAHELGLSCLVEVYDVRELDRIDFDQVNILGVNNRDLRTFEVDIEHSLRVFSETPRDVVRVSESGLESAQELAHLYRNGVDAVLIGESFMRAPQPGGALHEMRTALAEAMEAAQPRS